MNEQEKNAEEMERDVERARAEVSAKIDQIQSRLSPGQLMDQAIGYIRTSLPAEFGHNLSDAVRTNPVPVALIGVGIAWLAISGRNGSMPARTRDQTDHYRGSATDDLGESWDFTRGHAGNANVETHTRSFGARAGDAAHRASDVAYRAGDTASEMADQAKRKVGDTVRSARETLHRASDRTRSSMANARASAADMIEDQPLLLGALGLAVGAGLGASLPRTRVEDELMGDTRDDLMHGATERAREYADRAADTARDYAGRAAETAREKIHQVGAGTSGSGPAESSDRTFDREMSSHATANAPGRSNVLGSGSSSTSNTMSGTRNQPGFEPSEERPT